MLVLNFRPSFVSCVTSKRWFLCLGQVSAVQTYTFYGVQLPGQEQELFLISDIIQCRNIMGIYRDIPTETALMEQI